MDKKKRGPGRQRRRLWIQLIFTAVTNGYVAGFLKGRIYSGSLKNLCVPGLNCYSCPGALGACPLGALQATLGSRSYKFAFYVVGVLMVVGAFLGRVVCGFLCPFGLVQDLLHKIPLPRRWKKRGRLPGDRVLKWLKYVLLVLFCILLPLVVVDAVGQGSPWFCTYVCPSGTLMGSLPLLAANEALRAAVGWLWTWKIALLVGLLLLSVFVYRPFCRYLCPLGAVYGLFNPIAFYRFRKEESKCTSCGACRSACPFSIDVQRHPNSPECIRCGRCLDACPHDALSTSLKSMCRKGAAPRPHDAARTEP